MSTRALHKVPPRLLSAFPRHFRRSLPNALGAPCWGNTEYAQPALLQPGPPSVSVGHSGGGVPGVALAGAPRRRHGGRALPTWQYRRLGVRLDTHTGCRGGYAERSGSLFLSCSDRPVCLWHQTGMCSTYLMFGQVNQVSWRPLRIRRALPSRARATWPAVSSADSFLF